MQKNSKLPKNKPRLLVLADEINTTSNEVFYAMIGRARELGARCSLRACEANEKYHSHIESYRPDCILNLSQTNYLPTSVRKVPTLRLRSSTDSKPAEFQIDEFAIGERTGRHLHARGYAHIGMAGMASSGLAKKLTTERIEGLLQGAGLADSNIHRLDMKRSPVQWLRENPLDEDERMVREWLLALPKPIGLFCMNVWQAAAFISICMDLKLRVPQDVGIVGVGSRSDRVLGMKPGITVVNLPYQQISQEMLEAALDRLAGRPPAGVRRYAPEALIERGSTDIAYASDPMVASIVQYIRNHIDQPIKVGDLAERAGVSRSGFEKRFKEVSGYAPLAEIHRWRMRRAKDLLKGGTLSVKEIAGRCGIPDPYQFSAFFSKHAGVSPANYRKQIQGQDELTLER